MIYKDIVVAYDGSDPSREALVCAKNMIGDDPEATMHVVSVVPLGALGINDPGGLPTLAMQQIFPDMQTYEMAIDNAKSVALDGLNKAIEDLLDGVKCKIVSETPIATKPVDGICEYAEDVSADMIVMGRRGLGAFRAMLGSVSYGVLHETGIPVVTVK